MTTYPHLARFARYVCNTPGTQDEVARLMDDILILQSRYLEPWAEQLTYIPQNPSLQVDLETGFFTRYDLCYSIYTIGFDEVLRRAMIFTAIYILSPHLSLHVFSVALCKRRSYSS